MAHLKNLTPISFSARRKKFFEKIVQDRPNAIAVVPAHPELYRNDDVLFKFRQDSNFYYLTGFHEPDAIAVFRNVAGKTEYTLFVRPKDLEKEIWTGFRTGAEKAVAEYGADKAYSIEEFDAQFPKLLQGVDCLYYSFFRTLHRNGVEYLDQKIMRHLDDHRRRLGRTGKGLVPVCDTHEVLGEMRIIKSAEEILRMKTAAKISAFAHKEVMARVRPGISEFQVEALLEFAFLDSGAERHAYGSIVAGGANATVLHYHENNQELRDGDLLLVDAGCEVDQYASDITRTYAVNGTMSAPQRELYDITLAVQKECVKMARPGVALASIHSFAVDALTDAMIKLKFLSGDRKQLIESLAYKKYYPHGTGHLLGLDVHDAGLYQKDGEPRKLEPGMAFTIEPGFYVLAQDNSVPEKYRGIGIRIEDDVVITSNGCDVLTTDVPKEVKDIEALHGSKSWLEIS